MITVRGEVGLVEHYRPLRCKNCGAILGTMEFPVVVADATSLTRGVGERLVIICRDRRCERRNVWELPLSLDS